MMVVGCLEAAKMKRVDERSSPSPRLKLFGMLLKVRLQEIREKEMRLGRESWQKGVFAMTLKAVSVGREWLTPRKIPHPSRMVAT
jgi:hypothetical protein